MAEQSLINTIYATAISRLNIIAFPNLKEAFSANQAIQNEFAFNVRNCTAKHRYSNIANNANQ